MDILDQGNSAYRCGRIENDKAFLMRPVIALLLKKWCCLLGCLMILAASLVLSGCASKPSIDMPIVETLEWGSADSPSLIRWIAEIEDYRDTGMRQSLWKRFGNFLFGTKTEKIVRPYGIHADGNGWLLIADPGTPGVHSIAVDDGEFDMIYGRDGNPVLQPIGVVSDGQGTAYITDSVTGSIYIYSRKEQTLEKFNLDPLARPTGIAFNANNWQLYVTDTKAHQVVVFGLDGKERYRFSGRGAGPGELNFPTDLWIDRMGRVIVSDALNARLVVFNAGGKFLFEIGSRGHAAGYFDKPKGVAVDSDGHYYVCDALKDAVQVYDQDGIYMFKFGHQGQGPGELWMPAGIFIDKNDRIYVADAYNHRIQVFQYMKKATGTGG